MARCSRKRELEVHHERRTGGNGLSNAAVLCSECYQAMETNGKQDELLLDFTTTTIKLAKHAAGYRCQCTRRDCH